MLVEKQQIVQYTKLQLLFVVLLGGGEEMEGKGRGAKYRERKGEVDQPARGSPSGPKIFIHWEVEKQER